MLKSRPQVGVVSMAFWITRRGWRLLAVGTLVLGGCAAPQLGQDPGHPAARKVTECLHREAAVATGPQAEAAAATVLAKCQPDLQAEQTAFKSSHLGTPEAAAKDAVKLSAFRAEQAKDFVVLAKLAPAPAKAPAAKSPATAAANNTAPLVKPKRELPVSEVFRMAQKSVYLVIAGNSPEAMKRGDASLGSAVAVASNLALTNCHIIARRQLLAVVDADTKAVMRAHITKAHPQTDRCILKVEGALNPIGKIGKSQDVRVGERVYTIGNPSGMSRTLGEGLVSGLRQAPNGVQVIQTTAQISKGSSGGALLDSEGALIGITTFTLRDAQNLNFAIAAEEYFK